MGLLEGEMREKDDDGIGIRMSPEEWAPDPEKLK